MNTYRIVDKDGNSLAPGQSITINDPSYTISITYYVEKEHSLEIVTTTSNDGKTINLSANMDADSKFVSWNYDKNDGLEYNESESTLSISTTESSTATSFVVEAESDYRTTSITVYVTVETLEDGSTVTKITAE